VITTADEDEPDIGSLAVLWGANGNVYSARRTFLGWTWNPPAANADPSATLSWDDIRAPGLTLAEIIAPRYEDEREIVTASPGLRTKKRAVSSIPPRTKASKKKKHAPKPAIPPRLTPDRPIYFESPDELGVNIAVLAGGRTLTGVHTPERCAGDTCAIHAVTRHPLSEWPQEFDPVAHSISRVCEHGIMHPDPDEAPWRRALGRSEIHDCDGCCKEQYMLDAMKGWT
jgi:hypothetical protein